MSILVESAVKPTHRNRIYQSYRGSQIRVLNPHSMAKRMDEAIFTWKDYWSQAATTGLPAFVSPVRLKSLGAPSHIPYLPGRTPLHPDLKPVIVIRLNREIEMMVKQRWLPRSLEYIFVYAWKIILQDVAKFGLPYLVTERGLHHILRAAFDWEEIDLYARQKQIIRDLFLQNLEPVRRRIEQAPDPLAQALEIALRGNSFGRVETQAFFEGRLNLNLQQLIRKPISYYLDMRDEVLSRLKGPSLRMVYILDNAGESVWDLLFIEQLLKRGHSVTLVAKSLPTLNDETFIEIQKLILRHRFTHPNLKVIAGWDIPGIDLLSTLPEVETVFKQADLAIIKGEGNFEGMPPEHSYSLDLVYILKVKTPGLDHRISNVGGKPERNQGIIHFKHKKPNLD